MRCALCGGEIDSTTKQCTRCGECWGGGNRGIAQEVSREIEVTYEEPSPPSVIEKCINFINNGIRKADNAISTCAGKTASLFNKKTTTAQNRIIAYGFILFVLTAMLILSVISCTACSKPEICGCWMSADSDGSVSIEFSANGEVSVFVLSSGSEKVYRNGIYTVSDELLEIRYDDGETITLMFSIEKNTAVFTLLSTGQSQTYIRK